MSESKPENSGRRASMEGLPAGHLQQDLKDLQRGQELCSSGRFGEAVACFKAAAREPILIEAFLGLGLAYQAIGDYSRALEEYERGLKRWPNDARLRMQRAMLWLRTGDFERGWSEYDWRLRVLKITRDWIDRAPIWDAEPLLSRSLLVHCEQGLGDTLQFVRFLPRVRQLVGKTILLCQAPLGPLLRLNQVADEVIDSKVDQITADRYVALGSLPGRFGFPRIGSSPAKYLHADERLVESWRSRMQRIRGYRVGLVWSGNPLHAQNHLRSIPFTKMMALGKVPNVQLISLQKEAQGTSKAQEVGFSQKASPSEADNHPATVVDFGEELDRQSGPFMDTAAILEHLDLVITIDSAVGHLSAAMGRPTWILLPELADWRWQVGRGDTPWYSSVRLFRKSAGEDWQEVIDRVARSLSETVVAAK